MTNSIHLAKLALEVWRASGPRTETRRGALVDWYAESYYGSRASWPAEIKSLVWEAHLITKRNTRIDELQYCEGGR